MSDLPKFSISDLLDAGVHFGHKTNRWNPKMAPYIHSTRDGVHIMDLTKTAPLLYAALKRVRDVVSVNGRVLFVGTKVQAAPLIAQYAESCGQFYINHRWLGGMLTNWGTVSQSIKKMEELELILQDEDRHLNYTKKELLEIERKKDKLLRALGGIRSMGGRPDLIIIFDTNKENLALFEARKLKVETIAIVDSNSDPDNIDHIVPGNDDAIRSIQIYCKLFADAALAGIQKSLTASGVDIGELENAEISLGSEENFGRKVEGSKVVGDEKDDDGVNL